MAVNIKNLRIFILTFGFAVLSAIGEFLKVGRNLLEIELTNLSANRIRDLAIRKLNWKIFRKLNFVDQNYKKFDVSKWPLTFSGLLGLVT